MKNCDRGLYFDDFFLRERTYHPLRRNVILTQNGITTAAKCNTNAKCNNINAKCNKVIKAKCNNFPTQNVITFLTRNVITQIVITSELQVCSTWSKISNSIVILTFRNLSCE